MDITRLSNEADLVQKKETQNKIVLNLLIDRKEQGVRSFEAYEGALNGRMIKRLPARIGDLEKKGYLFKHPQQLGKHEVLYVLKPIDKYGHVVYIGNR